MEVSVRVRFRPFGINTYSAYGPEASRTVDQLAKIRASRFDRSITSCHSKTLHAVSITHIHCSRPIGLEFYELSIFAHAASSFVSENADLSQDSV